MRAVDDQVRANTLETAGPFRFGDSFDDGGRGDLQDSQRRYGCSRVLYLMLSG